MECKRFDGVSERSVHTTDAPPNRRLYRLTPGRAFVVSGVVSSTKHSNAKSTLGATWRCGALGPVCVVSAAPDCATRAHNQAGAARHCVGYQPSPSGSGRNNTDCNSGAVEMPDCDQWVPLVMATPVLVRRCEGGGRGVPREVTDGWMGLHDPSCSVRHAYTYAGNRVSHHPQFRRRKRGWWCFARWEPSYRIW